MTRSFRSLALPLCVIASIVVLDSCNKDNSGTSTSSSSSFSPDYITIAASASAAATDSVEVVQYCGPGGRRDSIAQSSLPASVTAYLDSSYAGYTFGKAYAVKDSSGTISGYVVVVYYNDQPVVIEFTSKGLFSKVLKLRDGHGRGGHFGRRDRHEQDSISLRALPSAVTSYIAGHYATDTLLKAYVTHDSSYLVLSRNNGLFATVFNASGEFVKRIDVSRHHAEFASIEQSAVPAAAIQYLTDTYPDFVFEKAYSASDNAGIIGYAVYIDANNIKYTVTFDDSGKFVASVVVR